MAMVSPATAAAANTTNAQATILLSPYIQVITCIILIRRLSGMVQARQRFGAAREAARRGRISQKAAKPPSVRCFCPKRLKFRAAGTLLRRFLVVSLIARENS